MCLFQEVNVVTQVGTLLNGEKVDAVICVAGGWAGGNAASKGNFMVFACWLKSTGLTLIITSNSLPKLF
jgi:dihydropteridine reductase